MTLTSIAMAADEYFKQTDQYHHHGCVINWEECHCICHKHKGIKHVVACCRRCEVCDKNILDIFYEDHLEDHKKKKEKKYPWL